MFKEWRGICRVERPRVSASCGPAWRRARACRAVLIRPYILLYTFFLASATVWAGSLSAATIDVAVVDKAGNPVDGVVVLAESKTRQRLKLGKGQQTTFEMDQRNLMFDPNVLVVPAGASVSFLNSDTTAHHVYSFSKTNRFALPLYKGRAPDPVVFETPGIVTLGCNIHDHMVGYIVVAESHRYARTDSEGRARLIIDSDPEDIRIRIWSPRIRDKQNQLVRDASVVAPVLFSLRKKLKPAIKPHPTDTTEWAEY